MDRVNRNPGQKFDGSELDWLLDEYLNTKASKVAATTLHPFFIQQNDGSIDVISAQLSSSVECWSHIGGPVTHNRAYP